LKDLRETPYGTWASKLSATEVAGSQLSLDLTAIDGTDGYWLEGRPREKGRQVILKVSAAGEITEILGPPFSARSRVHEYGGGSYGVRNGVVFFSNASDNVVYRIDAGQSPKALTLPGSLRFADFQYDPRHERLYCIAEDHGGERVEPLNKIAVIRAAGSPGEVSDVVVGNDFYQSPRLSPDGKKMAWLTWNHPHMPWESTELWIGDIEADGLIRHSRKVAGERGESIVQPQWSPDGHLYFVSDRSGWANLYRLEENGAAAICPQSAEFGRPLWIFGMSAYGFLSAEEILCGYCTEGFWQLGRLEIKTGKLRRLELPFTDLRMVRADSGFGLFIGGAADRPWALYRYDGKTDTIKQIRDSASSPIDPAEISHPRPLRYPTLQGQTAHGFFYLPQNTNHHGPAEEKPPLLVVAHGGPTSACSSVYNPVIQYWTSRGFAVLDVNYGGSTGYGKAYRERLNGQWGIVDVVDAIQGAQFLVEKGMVDRNRLAIRGGSAGGYTALCAIAFHNVFKAATSYYGVSDLLTLQQESHKFEAFYNFSLIGSYPEHRDRYHERSPVNVADQIRVPLLILQGTADKVVLPNQSEKMYEALRANGVPVAYLPFEGEEHGFRMKETIVRALEAELYFYASVFDFVPHDKLSPILIQNRT